MSEKVTWNGQALAPFLTPREIIATLNCSRSTVYELIASGELPCIRIGRAIRVPADDFVAWIDRCRRAGAA